MKVVPTLSICIFLLCFVAIAGALNPDRDIHQLAHRSWGAKEGYPGRSEVLAQTTDGFLWIGSDIGLFRFDGVHFEQYVPRSGDKLSENPIGSLLALTDGTLWIGYTFENKICLLRNGNLKCYGKADGVASYPTSIVQDHEGTIWANTWNGLIRFNGTRWEHIGRDWNFPEDVPHITSTVLFVDSHGTLWAGVHQTMLYLKQGSKRFESTGVYAGWSLTMAEASDGTLWFPDNKSYVRAVMKSASAKSVAIAEVVKCEVLVHRGAPAKCPSEVPPVVEISSAHGVFVDRNQGLWITTDTSGVIRIPHPERLTDRVISETSDALEKFNSKDGLSADACSFVLEDREGNIWVATRDGLDQFRDTTLVPVALPTSLFRVGLAPAGGGDIWVNGSWNYIARIHGDSRNLSFVPADVFKPYRDPAGVTWLMGDSLAQWKDGEFRKVALSPDGVPGSFGTWQITSDKFGTLWAFFSGHGFFTLDDYRWKVRATPPDVAKQHVTNMFSDSTGLIWVSTDEGDIITLDQGNVVDYPVKPDSPLRNVKAFAERAPHEIWAGGVGGLALIDNGHFRPIKPASDSFDDVTGLVDAGSEGLWLNTANGVIHIPRDEADRALRDPSYRFEFERIDSPDGLPGQTETLDPYPKAIQGTDGRIWFTAARGLAWIDPKKKISRNALPPPVSITSISANSSTHLQLADLRLPARTANIQISYTALSLAQPERVHFRYKLEGSDEDWQEVGTRREAFYTNLGPRLYRFRVIACNENGVWNNVGAVVEFTIAPAWYQTTWFRLCCVVAFLLLLWAADVFRVQQLKSQFEAGLETRVDERTRIARELHDTLLQSFQGAVFQFQAARKLLLRKADNSMQVVDDAIQAAEEGIREGRVAIQDLRPEPAALRNLAQLLEAAGHELAGAQELDGRSSSFRVLVEGEERTLSPMLQDEVYRISREVIRNAFAHAAASRIEVEIRYAQDQLRLRVRDDGKGIDPKVMEGDGPSGHWGIPGMRERAKRIGAHLDFWSEVGAGTEVELTVPASMAYQKQRDGHRFWLFQRANRDEQRS